MLNLNIESLQDTYYAKSKSSSFGISAGGGKGKDGISGNAGFNFGKTDSTTDSQLVNEQTSIIGNNSVNIKVGSKDGAEGNTNITGALIASGKYKEVELPESEWKVNEETGETIKTKIVFEDNGNLNLATNSLTYQDLNDFYKEETIGYNFGTRAGGNRTDQKETNLHPQGSTTIGLTHTGQEREQITRATIGLGNITIGNNTQTNDSELLAGLNRNVNNSQEITKDIITGALDGSMTIDNRVFTSDGRSEIANNFVNLPSNLVRAGAGATGSVMNILESAYNGAKNLSIDDAVDSWKANQSNLVAGQGISSNDKSREVINNLSEGKSQQDIENALNSGFAKYDDNGNIINTISLYNDVNDNNKGTHQNSTGNNYINSAYTDMKNTSDVLKVASHENAHNYTKNEDLANASQKYTAFSYFMGNVANLDSVNKNGIATNTSWNNTYGNTQHMNYNTSLVRSIGAEDRSNLRASEAVRDNKDKTAYNNFGPRYIDPKTGEYHKEYREGYKRRDIDHLGTDIASPAREEIYSVADGKVILNDNIRGYGNTVIVETTKDGNVVWALYGHMNELSDIPVGTKVQEGQPIGKVGNTGIGGGNHLHLGISYGDENGKYDNHKGWVDPNKVNIGNYEYRKDTPYYKQHNK